MSHISVGSYDELVALVDALPDEFREEIVAAALGMGQQRLVESMLAISIRTGLKAAAEETRSLALLQARECIHSVGSANPEVVRLLMEELSRAAGWRSSK